MASYRTEIDNPIPLILLTPTYTTSYGVDKKSFPTIEEALEDKNNIFYGSFKTYLGTERDKNGIWSVEDTAKIKTWFRPDITSECKIGVLQTGAIYDVFGEPENIAMRNQFLEFRVRRYKGQT